MRFCKSNTLNQTVQFNTFLSILVAAISITIGGLIYILFRPNPVVFFNWLKPFGLNIQEFKSIQPYQQINLPEWFIYSFPNFLWASAYSILIIKIWANSPSIIKYFWFASIPLLTFGYEFLQLTPLLTGTFCFQDLSAYFLGILLSILIQLTILKL